MRIWLIIQRSFGLRICTYSNHSYSNSNMCNHSKKLSLFDLGVSLGAVEFSLVLEFRGDFFLDLLFDLGISPNSLFSWNSGMTSSLIDLLFDFLLDLLFDLYVSLLHWCDETLFFFLEFRGDFFFLEFLSLLSVAHHIRSSVGRYLRSISLSVLAAIFIFLARSSFGQPRCRPPPCMHLSHHHLDRRRPWASSS